MEEYVIAVDIGGTNIRAALLNEKLEIVKKEVDYTADFSTAESFLKRLAEMVENIDSEGRAHCMGIVLPAPWGENNRVITDITNIPCLEGLKVEEICRYFKQYKIFFENDVNVIALLESECGAAKAARHSLYVTVSSGIGSGVIINGEIYHGAHGYAGEIGNVIITKLLDGESYHTLEEACSGLSLDEKSLALYGDGNAAKKIFQQHEIGDNAATGIILRWIDDLTNGLASVVQVMDPEIIVLGGSVVLKNQWVVHALEKEISKKVLGKLSGKIKVAAAQFGLEAGLQGAGYFALKQRRFC